MTDNPVRIEVLLKVELVFSEFDEEVILFFPVRRINRKVDFPGWRMCS
jgi:hypothetical protein